jgi:N-acyl-D-aspartate/D-glutamate deacylase
VRLAMADPAVMIASDGLITDGKGHPRGAGSYARVLAKYVRETQTLTLMEAVRKMSLMPAQRLEKVSPAMRDKGRIRAGADADITIFDAAKVQDQSSYEHPALASTGIEYVLVHGTAVVRKGELVDGVHPGRGVKSGAWPKEP